MSIRLIKLAVTIFGLTAVALLELVPTRAIADNRPQEVLDLIAAHQELAMKIRPLNDRVLIAAPKDDNEQFKPDGVPVRAKASAATLENNDSAEARAPERLRHKDRAANDGDDHGRIKVRFSALEENARKERERVNRPQFGVGLSQSDANEVADARKALAALEREFAALQREEQAQRRRAQ